MPLLSPCLAKAAPPSCRGDSPDWLGLWTCLLKDEGYSRLCDFRDHTKAVHASGLFRMLQVISKPTNKKFLRCVLAFPKRHHLHVCGTHSTGSRSGSASSETKATLDSETNSSTQPPVICLQIMEKPGETLCLAMNGAGRCGPWQSTLLKLPRRSSTRAMSDT